MKKNLIAMTLILASATAAVGQTEKIDTLRESALQQVVVTGTGTHHQQRDAVVPVRVLTAADLRDAHITTLEEALVLLTPNITTMTNGMGTTLSINGLPEDYILILENGQRLTGDDRYTRIPMASIKRIEVLSAASSALYGSEAIAGVINIITSPSGSTRGKTPESIDVNAMTHLSTHDRFTESISANIRHGALQSSTSFQNQSAGGYQVNDQELVLGKLKPTGRLMAQPYHSIQASQRFTWNFNNGLQVYVRGSIYDYRTQRPQQAQYYKGTTKKNTGTGLMDSIYTLTPAYSYDLHRRDVVYGAGATWRISPKVYLEAHFHSDNLMSERDSFDTYIPGGTQLTKGTHYYNTTVRGIFTITPKHKLSAGMEYEHETYKSYNFNFRTMGTFALYAQDEMRLARDFQAVAGLRYLHHSRFGSHATPTVQVMYTPGPVQLRAGYSTGFRTPTLLQMHYENDETKTITIGNLTLQPEKSHFVHFEAEYHHRYFTIQAGAFLNKVRDMISYRTLTDAEADALGLTTQYPTATKYQQRDNINKATVKGIHLGAEYYLPMGLRLGGAYTLTDAEGESVALDKATQTYQTTTEPVDRSVKHSGTAHISWAHSWSNYDLHIRLQSHMQGRRWSTSYGYAPRYSQIDLNTTHTWHLAAVDLEPGVGIHNLLNKRDTRPWCSNFSTITPGISPYISFAVHFHK